MKDKKSPFVVPTLVGVRGGGLQAPALLDSFALSAVDTLKSRPLKGTRRGGQAPQALAKASTTNWEGNTIALGEFDMAELHPSVEHDAENVPIAWRIFKYGKNEIFQNGNRLFLSFTDEVFDSIISFFEEKGADVPLDSKHFLFRLAEHYGVTEDEILKVLPDGRGTFGFGKLEKRDDGLWITNIEYVPLARKLMADGTFRYFSPVIRGFTDGTFRVSSVTMTNNPSINNLDSLAASEDEEEPPFANVAEINHKLCSIALSADDGLGAAESVNKSTKNTQQKEMSMKELLIVIGTLVGTDSLALSDDGAAPEGLVDKLKEFKVEHDALQAGKKASDEFLAGLKGPLALDDGADLNKAQGKILSLVDSAKGADDAKKRLDALELEAETTKVSDLVAKGKAEGKLTENMLEWAGKQTAVALSEFLETANVDASLVGKLDREKLGKPDEAGDQKRAESYKAALSDDDVSGAIANCPILD